MVDLASIRNASFSLTPTGYNPEEVDRFLSDLADSAESGIDLAVVRNASFSLTPTGYNPEEVDRFLAQLADGIESPAAEPQAVQESEEAPAQGQEQVFEAPAEPAEEPVAELEQPFEADELEPVAEAHEVEPVAEPVAEVEAEPVAPAETVQPVGDAPVATLPHITIVERQFGDLGSLQDNVERAVAALQSFVQVELRNVREASVLEFDDVHAERNRLIEEAAEAGRAHIDETNQHAARILAQARHEGDLLRQKVEAELRAEREQFEKALAERDAQAQARVAEILADAEHRRREADELVASAAQAQAHMLASFEQARSSLIEAAERNLTGPQVQVVQSPVGGADELDEHAAA
jgi:DivIVA domain-containing protein